MSAASPLGARAALAGAPRAPGKKGLGGRIHAAAVNRRAGFPSPRASIAEPPGSDAPTGEADEAKRAKVSMVSLGCPKNTVDGEVMLGDLFANGFDVVDDHDDADAVIVNTCGFVEDAKNESVDAILAAARLKSDSEAAGGKKKVIVTGCLAQRYAEDLAAEMPEVDVVMGFEEYKNLPGALGSALGLSLIHI